MNSCEQRRERLRSLMRDYGLAAMLVSQPANRYYLASFELHDVQINESAGHLLVLADGDDWICTDGRYLDAARRIWDRDHILIYGADAAGEIARLAKKVARRRGQIGFEANFTTLPFFQQLAEVLGNDRLMPVDGLVETLRMIKEPEEIRRMEASAALNERLMRRLPDMLEPGMSEASVSWMIEKFFRENGAEGLAFASIVGVGCNAALPHYLPSREIAVRNEEMVLIDMGCRLNDYCSDQTRTFWVGEKPSSRFQYVRDAVREAQRRAIGAIRPGAVCRDVFAAATSYFEELHVADAFTHSLGHGVGLETHERPSLNRRNSTVLKPGMVVTAEPGLYWADWGGVRWEHTVLVTEDGCVTLGSGAI